MRRSKRGTEAWLQTKFKNKTEFDSELHGMADDDDDDESSDVSFRSNRNSFSLKDINNLNPIPTSVITKFNNPTVDDIFLNSDKVAKLTSGNPNDTPQISKTTHVQNAESHNNQRPIDISTRLMKLLINHKILQ